MDGGASQAGGSDFGFWRELKNPAVTRIVLVKGLEGRVLLAFRTRDQVTLTPLI